MDGDLNLSTSHGFGTSSLMDTTTSRDYTEGESRRGLRTTFMVGGVTARRNSGLRAFHNSIALEAALSKVIKAINPTT
jgi:hypothetical protein